MCNYFGFWPVFRKEFPLGSDLAGTGKVFLAFLCRVGHGPLPKIIWTFSPNNFPATAGTGDTGNALDLSCMFKFLWLLVFCTNSLKFVIGCWEVFYGLQRMQWMFWGPLWIQQLLHGHL